MFIEGLSDRCSLSLRSDFSGIFYLFLNYLKFLNSNYLFLIITMGRLGTLQGGLEHSGIQGGMKGALGWGVSLPLAATNKAGHRHMPVDAGRTRENP